MRKLRKGQTMVEYIIIVALIAIACLGIVSIFGKTLFTKFKGANDSLTSQKASATYDDNSIQKLGE